MAVTVAGTVENLRTGTTDPWTWSHNSGTTSPQAVVVSIIHGTSSTDHVVSVTYGTRALRRIVRATDTATESGSAELWFAGGSIPTGTQTISVDLSSATTDDLLGTSVTLDGAFDLVPVSTGTVQENAANPSVQLANAPGNSSMAFAAFYSGLTALTDIAPGTDCTEVSTNELSGNFTGSLYRQTTAGTGTFTIAATASNDDCAFAAANFAESVVVATGGSYTYTGTAATLKRGLPVDAGSYTLTGTAATISRSNARLDVGNADPTGIGSYTIIGSNSLIDIGVTAVSGSYTLSGTDAGLIQEGNSAKSIAADEGVYALTGTDANLKWNQLFHVDVGEYVVSGTAVTFKYGRVYPVDSGVYAISGQDVTLIDSGETVDTPPLLACMGYGR